MKRSCKLLRVDYKGEVMYGVVICWYAGLREDVVGVGECSAKLVGTDLLAE